MPKKQKTELYSRYAETLAALYLQCKGYRVLKRRWRTPVGEIDLLLQKGGELILVEVKQRPDFASGAAAISRQQQERLNRAAAYALAEYQNRAHNMALNLRFDAVLVNRFFWPRHIKDAWQT